MITINVAPEVKISTQYTDLLLGVVVLSVCVVISYSGPMAYGMFIQNDIDNVQKSIEEKNKQKQNAEVDSKKVKEMLQVITELQQRQNRIKSINTNRKLPVRVLEKLQLLHDPEKMTLSNILFSGGQMQLTGLASDNGVISDYIKKLQENIDNKENDSAIDIKNFDPTFNTLKSEENIETVKTETKITFSNVTLRKSIAENVDPSTAVIKFELDVQVIEQNNVY